MRVLIHRPSPSRCADRDRGGRWRWAASPTPQIPDANGVIHGCRNDQSGELRVIESGDCRPSESALDWVQSSGHEVFLNVPFTPAVEITAVGPAARQHVMTLDLPPGGWHHDHVNRGGEELWGRDPRLRHVHVVVVRDRGSARGDGNRTWQQPARGAGGDRTRQTSRAADRPS